MSIMHSRTFERDDDVKNNCGKTSELTQVNILEKLLKILKIFNFILIFAMDYKKNYNFIEMGQKYRHWSLLQTVLELQISLTTINYCIIIFHQDLHYG